MIFFFEKILSIFDIENWLWKYDFGTFWQTGAPHILKIQRFPLSMSILGQKACILGPTIFKIPQPNWYQCAGFQPIKMHSTALQCSIRMSWKFGKLLWKGRKKYVFFKHGYISPTHTPLFLVSRRVSFNLRTLWYESWQYRIINQRFGIQILLMTLKTGMETASGGLHMV